MSKGIPVLPPNTEVPISIGTGFVQQLFTTMGFMLSDKSPEQIAALNKAIEENTYNDEPWMAAYVSIAVLVKHIEEVAVEKNLVTYSDLSEQDSPSAPQVQ
jgi:hypothetical protein